jgi:hypothetical protein
MSDFTEWVKNRGKGKSPKKPKVEPVVHHDLDSWLQKVDAFKKELQQLKDKLKNAPAKKPEEKKIDIAKPEKPVKLEKPKVTIEPKPEKEDNIKPEEEKKEKEEEQKDLAAKASNGSQRVGKTTMKKKKPIEDTE